MRISTSRTMVRLRCMQSIIFKAASQTEIDSHQPGITFKFNMNVRSLCVRNLVSFLQHLVTAIDWVTSTSSHEPIRISLVVKTLILFALANHARKFTAPATSVGGLMNFIEDMEGQKIAASHMVRTSCHQICRTFCSTTLPSQNSKHQ